MGNMGFGFGLEKSKNCFKRKFRWLLVIPGISASNTDGVNALPPSRSARPNLSFKEIQVEHLNETIYLPSKPDWKPITLHLYDLQKNEHPIFKWIQSIYNPSTGHMSPPVDGEFIKEANLFMLDGCGEIVESWIFENIWPNAVDFGELDMGSSEIVTCDLTLRYARAYIV